MTGFSGIFDAHNICELHADCLAQDTGASAAVCGRIRNTASLRAQLPAASNDAELLLAAYRQWGERCIERIEGAVICIVIDRRKRRLLLAADRMGEAGTVFYAPHGDTAAFASHPKQLLAFSFVRRTLDAAGLRELFGLGPARTPGKTPLTDIRTLPAGHMLTADEHGQSVRCYFRLESAPHEDDLQHTADTVRQLTEQAVEDTVRFSPASMLSGGLDSTVLTALLHKSSRQRISTFSLDYEDNAQHFRSGSYQPERDTPYIEQAVKFLDTDHTHVVLSIPALIDALEDAVQARGFPGMADIDSSLLLFARRISKEARYVLSGECGDEVFGGYPWFNRQDLIEKDCFPWSGSVPLRCSLLKEEIRHALNLSEYVADCWHDALARQSILPGEDAHSRKLRQLQGICFEYFMRNLQERASMLCGSAGVSVFTPFCDDRLVQYVYNVPWAMKRTGGQEKGLLRHSMRSLLPDSLLLRKKSPFPKTHHPLYTTLVKEAVRNMLSDSASPILLLIDQDAVRRLLESDLPPAETPWFGQLMSGPQMLAYLLQVNQWMQHFGISV